jgi:hypothetical protein
MLTAWHIIRKINTTRSNTIETGDEIVAETSFFSKFFQLPSTEVIQTSLETQFDCASRATNRINVTIRLPNFYLTTEKATIEIDAIVNCLAISLSTTIHHATYRINA